jgi:predicted DCC family thiol-disulfide oxidoreductase YuxK
MSSQVMNLILYDGVCGFCNYWVQFVLDHDPKGQFHFASLQSEIAQSILLRHKKDPNELSTVYLLENFEPGSLTRSTDRSGTEPQEAEKLYLRSEAALRIGSRLTSPLAPFLKAALFIFPAPLRDWGYKLVAHNRYKIAGKLESCRLPSSQERARFLDIEERPTGDLI